MPSERILVVDDDPAILALCQRILAAEGYTVIEAKRGEEALAKLELDNFDLLLTDIRLPGLNGLQVTERLRERNLDITVITMTGYSNMEMAIQALSLGVDEFLIKPFTLDSLRVTVGRALEKSRLRRENTRLRTLVPLLKTAQKLVRTRTREQVYEQLFISAGGLFETQNLMFVDVSADTQVLTVTAARGDALANLKDRVFYTSQIPGAAFFFEDVQVWNERTNRRLPIEVENISWLVSTPLNAYEHTHGLLIAAVSEEPTKSNLDALYLVAAQASATLENVDLLGEISRAYVSSRELERLKSEFISIAGHELRTPLTVLHGYALLLRDTLDNEAREYADQVILQAERLQHISTDMLNLASLEEGNVKLRLERCPIEQVVREVVNAYRTLAVEREQSIEMEIPDQIGAVTADRAMLDLILGSLLSNALKFSPQQTRVRVAAQCDENQVTLRIQDQGRGLTSEQAGHVFDPFYQASSSLTRSEGGLGLGLTLARKMVNAHGGKIWVESEHHIGSSFYITLPREITSSTPG